MTFRIRYTERALSELHAATNWIANRAPETAERWFDGFVATIRKLQINPQLYPFAPENKSVAFEIRQTLYVTASRKVNRALFTIREGEVIVLAIRRPGQRLVGKLDLLKRVDELGEELT